MKKAVEMSLNTIVIAVLVLLVLAILAFLLLGGAKNFTTKSACIKEGGTCQNAPCPTGYEQVSSTELCPSGSGQVCCRVQLTP
ncbi:hypothetical protein C4573_01255 [Candidatus Woesearchaeota archaeon]|nr:MAG: hypothetical protein C4573_01255 [Candidatus Woesearchaeota archaeon]